MRFVEEFHDVKRSIKDDASLIKGLMPHIGHLPISAIRRETLDPLVRELRRKGRKPATINNYLKIVRRILRLAAFEWCDYGGLTWLASPPKITLLSNSNPRQPYPMTLAEQARLLSKLPAHLLPMIEFAINTGARDAEICNLEWDWEVPVPTFDTLVFRLPQGIVKNDRSRFILLNETARQIVDRQRGKHRKYVFTYRGNPIQRMNNSAWRGARTRTGLPHLRVHDTRHTFATRLRALGVSHEDRGTLLGHVTTSITTHYSAPDFKRLLEAVNKLCNLTDQDSELIVLR